MLWLSAMSFTSLISVSFSLRGEPYVVVFVVRAFIPKSVIISETQKFSLRGEPCVDKRLLLLCKHLFWKVWLYEKPKSSAWGESPVVTKGFQRLKQWKDLKNTHHYNKLYVKRSMCSLGNLMTSGMTLGHFTIQSLEFFQTKHKSDPYLIFVTGATGIPV